MNLFWGNFTFDFYSTEKKYLRETGNYFLMQYLSRLQQTNASLYIGPAFGQPANENRHQWEIVLTMSDKDFKGKLIKCD